MLAKNWKMRCMGVSTGWQGVAAAWGLTSLLSPHFLGPKKYCGNFCKWQTKALLSFMEPENNAARLNTSTANGGTLSIRSLCTSQNVAHKLVSYGHKIIHNKWRLASFHLSLYDCIALTLKMGKGICKRGLHHSKSHFNIVSLYQINIV